MADGMKECLFALKRIPIVPFCDCLQIHTSLLSLFFMPQLTNATEVGTRMELDFLSHLHSVGRQPLPVVTASPTPRQMRVSKCTAAVTLVSVMGVRIWKEFGLSISQ